MPALRIPYVPEKGHFRRKVLVTKSVEEENIIYGYYSGKQFIKEY